MSNLPVFFENGWYLESIKSITKAYCEISNAISNRENEIDFCIFYPNEVKSYIESTSGGLFEITHDDKICAHMTVKINIDYDALSINEFIKLRNEVGGKVTVRNSNLWIKFLTLLARI